MLSGWKVCNPSRQRPVNHMLNSELNMSFALLESIISFCLLLVFLRASIKSQLASQKSCTIQPLAGNTDCIQCLFQLMKSCR